MQVGKADKVDRRLLDQRRVVYGHIAVAVNIAEYRSVVKGVDLAADILQIIKTGIIDRFISCVIGNALSKVKVELSAVVNVFVVRGNELIIARHRVEKQLGSIRDKQRAGAASASFAKDREARVLCQARKQIAAGVRNL